MHMKLKAKRVEKGLTQEEMAKLLGMAVATYNRNENGLTKITIDTARKILKILDCSFDDIFLD